MRKQATTEEEADEESETEICDNTIDDDGDGLVDTEDNEDCPAPEEEAATEEEPTPTPEAEEEAAPEEENSKKQMKSLKLRSATTL